MSIFDLAVPVVSKSVRLCTNKVIFTAAFKQIKMNKWFVFFRFSLIFILMNACNQKKQADLIITNATVYTVDENFSKVESFAVKDGKIAAGGTTSEILTQFSSKNIIHAEGKFIYPGFNDGHCHFNGYAANLMQYADLRETKSPEEIYERLKLHHEKFKGDWILGRSWDQNDWENTSFPDKEQLDKLFPDIPVYLVRVDGHAGWCNSKALEMAGITANTKVSGGEVVVKNGKPTGILIDNAMGLVRENYYRRLPANNRKKDYWRPRKTALLPD